MEEDTTSKRDLDGTNPREEPHTRNSHDIITNNNDDDQGNETPRKEDTSPTLMGLPPDGGWGWMVVFASFSISLLVDGVCFSFGIFFDEFRHEFGTSKGTTSWIGSVLNGTYLLVGPIISVLVNIYGCKKVTWVGGVVAFVAFFLSTFSNSIGLLIFSYGFAGGIGIGLMYLPAIVMVGHYFEKRRALATGIACCGSGIGAFVFAPLNEYLLHEYGWRGATWILAALLFHGIILALFYRPLPPATIQPRASQLEAGKADTSPVVPIELKSVFTNGQENDASFTPLVVKIPNNLLSDHQKSPPISEELRRHIYETLKQDISLTQGHRSRSMTIHSPESPEPSEKVSKLKDEISRLAFSQDTLLFHNAKVKGERTDSKQTQTLPPLQRKDIFYSGSLWHLKEFKEHGSTDEFRREMTKVSSDGDETDGQSKKGFFQGFSDLFDLSLLRSPTFLIYGTSCFLCMAGFFVPFIYMPTHALDMGIDSQNAALLISIIGITNTIGRVAVGFVSDQPWADCLLINNVALIIGGVVTIFVPYFPEYYLLAIYATIFGTAIAVFVSLRSIIMVELLGLQKLTTAFGFVMMCQGLSSLIGAPIVGAISDSTGNYNAAFYLAGIFLALSGLICLPLRRIARWENSKKPNPSQTATSSPSSKRDRSMAKAKRSTDCDVKNTEATKPMLNAK